MEFLDSTVKRHFDQYFMISCQFTSTRRDKFFFDDIFLGEIVEDGEAPQLLDHELLSDRSLQLIFDEVIDRDEAQNELNYLLSNNGQYPAQIDFNEFKPNKLQLFFDLAFESNIIYNLEIKGIKDLNGNAQTEPILLNFYLSETAGFREILVNEVLFNPFEDGEDFVELYNNSGKIIKLDGLVLVNATKNTGASVKLNLDLDLFPGQYIAISPDTGSLHHYYDIPDTAGLIQYDLPGLNNDNGNVSLYTDMGDSVILIDSFDYDEIMHFSLINNVEGTSLERVFASIETNDPVNWHSASSIFGGATPGYRNSQIMMHAKQSAEYFAVPKSTFSPDNDGYDDQLIVQYKLPENGYIGTISVFDITGNHVKMLINNKLLGTDGVIGWDGLGGNGEMLPIGPYIINCTAFHPSGEVMNQKLVCLLAAKL